MACSVALQLGDAVFERHEELPREHTRLLMPMIRSVLEESGKALRDLDAIVLGNGPGSFIGMRIAASVAQGLAYASGLPVVPVSSLAAVAGEVLTDEDVREVVVVQDAHMNEVYLGIYGRDSDGLAAARAPERLHGQGPIDGLDPTRVDGRVAAGFGWQRYPELLAANERWVGRLSGVWHPRARFLLPLGTAAVSDGRVIDPKELNPAYLRQKVAEKPTGAP
jgi:tRNA threonylcarbamoyladenosine biosynthesis protein TsaB